MIHTCIFIRDILKQANQLTDTYCKGYYQWNSNAYENFRNQPKQKSKLDFHNFELIEHSGTQQKDKFRNIF